MTIQESGGTVKAVQRGVELIKGMLPEINQDEIEESRKGNLESVLHKSDQLLRILIGEIVNETERNECRTAL